MDHLLKFSKIGSLMSHHDISHFLGHDRELLLQTVFLGYDVL